MATSMIAFHLTDRCQLNCHHCLRDPQKVPKDLDVDVIKNALDAVTTTHRIRYVSLTGGEPTLHPRFYDVVDAIADRDCEFHFVTNGKNLAQVFARLDERPARAQALANVILSLDGANESTHDYIRGDGSFREVMAATSVCTARNVPFTLQMTLHAQNVDQIEKMGLMAAELEAQHVSFAMMQPTGTALDEQMYLTAKHWRHAQSRVQRLKSILNISVILPEGFAQDEPFHVCEPFQSRVLHVDVDGRLTLCCQHAGIPGDGTQREVAGDLKQVSFHDAQKNLLRIIHDAQSARLERMALNDLGEWDYFPCNDCMKAFGKPHWTDEGVGGPGAKRERWRGAWSEDKVLARAKRLRVLP